MTKVTGLVVFIRNEGFTEGTRQSLGEDLLLN